MVTQEEINGYFLEAIRRLKAEGYTQKDIVKAAGLSQNAISKIKKFNFISSLYSKHKKATNVTINNMIADNINDF